MTREIGSGESELQAFPCRGESIMARVADGATIFRISPQQLLQRDVDFKNCH